MRLCKNSFFFWKQSIEVTNVSISSSSRNRAMKLHKQIFVFLPLLLLLLLLLLHVFNQIKGVYTDRHTELKKSRKLLILIKMDVYGESLFFPPSHTYIYFHVCVLLLIFGICPCSFLLSTVRNSIKWTWIKICLSRCIGCK